MAMMMWRRPDYQNGDGNTEYQGIYNLLMMLRAMVKEYPFFISSNVVVPENGHVGLHADNMTIDHISVDGESADFEFFQHYQVAQDDRRWSSVSCSSSSADAACSTYVSFLDKEMAPNLFIYCHKSVKSGSDPQQQANGEDNSVYLSSGGSQDDACRNNGDMMHEVIAKTNYFLSSSREKLYRNIRPGDHCPLSSYDLEFTVDSDLVAVSNGTLLYQEGLGFKL
ncbi:hypothetical protein ACLOJK_023856 [Asimina triloba]